MKKLLAVLVTILSVSTFADAGITGLFIDRHQTDAWYLKASLYEQNKDFEEASKLLEVILETHEDEHIYLKLSGIYRKLFDKEMVKYTLERGVRKFPNSPELLGALGDAYREDEKTAEKSYKFYQKAYEISGNPRYAEAEAIAHAALKDFNGAIHIYNMLIKKDVRSHYYVQRARFSEKLGLEQDAINDYIKASEIDDNFVASARMADYYLDTDDAENAIIYLKKVIKASPSMTLAKFKMAQMLSKIGKNEEAEEYYTAILPHLNEGEKIYVLKNLAKMAFDRKDFDKAEEYFAQAFEIDHDIKTAYSLAILAERAREFETAKSWYKEILEIRPDFVEAKKRLAIVHILQKDPDRALEALKGVEEIYQDVDYYRLKAQAYSDKKDYKTAEDILSNAVKLNPAEVKLYVDLALAIDRQGDKKGSEATIKEGMKYFPEDPSLLNFLGYIYAEQGINLDKAEELIKAALKKKPREAAYLDSMAWVYYQKGEYKKAYEFQVKALKGAPEEDEIIRHMNEILKKLGSDKTIEEILNEN